MGFVSGDYVAGTRLDPTELAERYQISKTPIIQALKRMAHEHIVELMPGGKYEIPVATREDIADVCEARLLFEEQALVKLGSDITSRNWNSWWKRAGYTLKRENSMIIFWRIWRSTKS